MNKESKGFQERDAYDSENTGDEDRQKDTSLNLPSGLRRTLSTELVTKQAELRTLMEINSLFKKRSWKPGEVIIQKGDMDRDLFILTKGVVEIWAEEQSGCLLLNEVDAPNILGDVAFLSGLPRTVTVKAKTEVKSFILKYENFISICKGTPEWLAPLVSSLVSGIKGLHYKIADLEDKI